MPIRDIRAVAEVTTPAGPILDYFYVVVVGNPPRMYAFPMEAAGSELFSDASTALGGPIEHGLANCVDHANRVMWPPVLAGQALFRMESLPAPKGIGGRIRRLLGIERFRYTPTKTIEDHFGVALEWADGE